MKRAVLLGLGGLALLAIGGFAGWRLHRPGADARAYAEMRLIAVQVSLDEAPPDYVFWAGDSQVELQPGSQRPCGLEFLNGGISGATAASYADYLARLSFKVSPRLAVLTIGTNDILVKNNPQLHKPTEQFEAAAETIVRRLQTLSPRVVVTALPRSVARSASWSTRERSRITRVDCRTSVGGSGASSRTRSRPCATATPATRSPARSATGCISRRSGRR